MTKAEFKIGVNSRKTAYGLFLSIQTNCGFYGQAYKNGIKLSDAKKQFLDFYYKLYKENLGEQRNKQK